MTNRLQHITTILLLLLMVGSGKAWGQWTWTDPSSGVGYKKISYAYTGNATNNTNGDAFDAKVDTKFCANAVGTDGSGGAIIICQTSKAIKLTGYTFITANDNHEKQNVQWYRNPGKWKIYGCNTNSSTESDWTLLVDNTSAIDMTMENRPYHSYKFTCTPQDNTKYTYFKLVITSTQGQALVQFSEFYPRELESENYPMVYYGTLPSQYGYYAKINVPQNRTHNSITLTGDQGSNTSQTIDNTTKVAFHDKTITPMELVVGETGTLAVTSGDASNVGAYLYIDADKDGFATSDMVQSITTGANDQWEMTVPSTLAAGRYRMRFKTEGDVPKSGSYVSWVDNTIDKSDPYGSIYYMLNGGCATDMMLHVYQPYTLTLVNKPANASVSVAEAKEASYTADGTVYVIKSSLDESDVTVTEISGYRSTISINNTNHTITVNYISKCSTPSFSQSENNVTINCASPTTGATIYYTTNGTVPSTTNGTSVASGTTITVAYDTTIKAIAVADGYDNSDVAEYFVSERPTGSGTADDPYIIISGSQLNNIEELLATKSDAYFKLNAEINASGYTPSSNAFTGTFDGNFKTITGLTKALFSSVTGTVKNVTLDNVTISGDGNVGAIANEASGNARIYNCQVLASGSKDFIANRDNEDKAFTSTSTVSGSGAVGGIVGLISGNARVINCVSYADVYGGTYGAGIVGKYEGNWITNTGETVDGNGNMVMNCLMLGDVKSGSTQMSPVVGGNGVTATISNWDYFRYASMPNVSSMKDHQNGALTIDEDKWLKRYEFFRSCLNNHRDLAAVYCFDDASRMTEMAKWTIDESISPWPILKAHDSNTRKTLDRVIPTTTEDNAGKQLGTLSVTAIINGSSRTVDLPITDMDHAHYDYTWGKVILPFANEFTGWTPETTTTDVYDRIIIGWEITSLTGGTTGTFSDYNFADRDCTAKDVYNATTNPFIYAQGGMFIVPTGVTAITITAHWADAYYVADQYYDMDISKATSTWNDNNFIRCGGMQRTTYNGKKVYNSARAAQDAWSIKDQKVHSRAIVLVGNYHYIGKKDTDTEKGLQLDYSKGCTIMSIDEDCDQEPDYGWYNGLIYSQLYQQNHPALRWDFIPTYATGIFQPASYRTMAFSLSRPHGWTEFTETCLARSFEMETWEISWPTTGINPFIINGGYHTQFIRGRAWSTDNQLNRLSYVKVGGNAFVKEFFQGNHSSESFKWKLIPTNVTGGEITYCYMTGQKSAETVITDGGINNVRFYCSGGKIGKFLGCYMEYPVNNVTANIDHAIFDKFYGGGTTQAGHVRGNIMVNIKNSYVEDFCGGPEFGNMESGKTVTVNADNTTFGTYYGAGFGGTAMTRIKSTASTGELGDDPDASSKIDDYEKNYYLQSKTGGIGVYYEVEEFMNARGQYYFRFYDYTADLNLASTGNVTSMLNNCKIINDFYGGGCQGKVNGTITSTLKDCDVQGSVFGGGYKAAATEVDVYAPLNTWPKFDDTFGAFDAVQYPTPTPYKWEYVETMPSQPYGTNDNGENVLYTTTKTSQMGVVTGAIDLTITNGTVGGSVFGGGNESLSENNTSVKILGTAEVEGNVYGGGNAAEVQGTTTVQIGEECVTE